MQNSPLVPTDESFLVLLLHFPGVSGHQNVMSDPVSEGHMRKESARLRSTNSAHGHILHFYTANTNLAINNLIQDHVEEIEAPWKHKHTQCNYFPSFCVCVLKDIYHQLSLINHSITNLSKSCCLSQCAEGKTHTAFILIFQRKMVAMNYQASIPHTDKQK